MPEDPNIATWLQEFTLWDMENEEVIQLNDLQRQDINRILQKRYGLLQWEQGSGKTLAAIATVGVRENVGSSSSRPETVVATKAVAQKLICGCRWR